MLSLALFISSMCLPFASLFLFFSPFRLPVSVCLSLSLSQVSDFLRSRNEKSVPKDM